MPSLWAGVVLLGFAGCIPAETEGDVVGDNQTPQVSIVSGPEEGMVTAAGGAEFVVVSTVEGSAFECQIDGGGFSACESPVVLDGLEDGRHTFEVRARGPAPDREPIKPAAREWRVASEGGEWLTMVVDGPKDTGRYNSMVVVAGRPVITYYRDTPDDLGYAYPLVDRPRSDADWLSYAVDVRPSSGLSTSVGVLSNGLPAIAYSGDFILRFSVAANAQPQDENDWTTHVVDPHSRTAQTAEMALVDGVPIIIHFDRTGKRVKVAQGLSAFPSGPGDWRLYYLEVDSPQVEGFDIAVLDGRPVASFINRYPPLIYYARAAKPVPAGAEDWSLHVVHDEIVASDTSLEAVAGRPAMCYFDAEEGDLWFAMANGGSPESKADWKRHVVDSVGDVGTGCSLVVWQGRPVVAYIDLTRGQLKVAVARVPFPTTNSDWRIEVVDVDQGAFDGITAMVVLPSGELAIAYYDGNADDLKFAIGVPAGTAPAPTQ